MSLTDQFFVKGHCAENDFVVLPDPDGLLDLSAQDVVRLCDRRSGLGADAVLRAVRTVAVPQAAHLAGTAEWFMDYRNADGSYAETCGNSLSLFAHYLVDSGRARPGTVTVATLAGRRRIRLGAARPDRPAPVSVSMGFAGFSGSNGIYIAVDAWRWPAHLVDLDGRHAVAFVDDLAHADGLRHAAPTVTPATADRFAGTVAFVRSIEPRHLAIRVHKRTVSEVRACGTAACAAVAASRHRSVYYPAADYRVDLPGGSLTVSVTADGRMTLTGPAEIVAEGSVRLRRNPAVPIPSGA